MHAPGPVPVTFRGAFVSFSLGNSHYQVFWTRVVAPVRMRVAWGTLVSESPLVFLAHLMFFGEVAFPLPGLCGCADIRLLCLRFTAVSSDHTLDGISNSITLLLAFE